LLIPILALACGDPEEPMPDGGTVPTLEPEPAGAPTDRAAGRLTCLGDNTPKPATGNTLELTGWIRALADPDADNAVPLARVEAFSSAGTSLGVTFTDRGKKGRSAVTVPITTDGFTGHVVVTSTEAPYLDYRFETSHAVTDTTVTGWVWLTTDAEADSKATAAGVTRDPAKGVLFGGVLDCDEFGVANAVVTIDGATGGVIFVQGFDLVVDATYTTASGRFVVPNLSPGPVTIKAWGRSESGGKLSLLSSITTTIEGGKVNAVALQPR